MKDFIKKIIGDKMQFQITYSGNLYHKLFKTNNKKNHKLKRIQYLLKTTIYNENSEGKSLKKLFSKIKLSNILKNDKFYYNIDIYKTIYISKNMIANLTIDYNKILKNSLLDIKNSLKYNKINEEFYYDELNTLQGIEILIDRTVLKLKKNKCNNIIINSIKNIKEKKVNTLYEALQRILFFNQLVWQTYHNLNGLGRLDMMLMPYYKKDIEDGIISKQEARELIKEFLKVLHRYYEFKSASLIGDTGQIIELGGKNINGEYEYNELTYMFIELMEELRLPDPKVLLRVSKNMPRDLIEQSLKCIQTGIGCPLFANDDVIIDKLIKFGYDEKDAYNYGTSACWEPYIIGKSFDQNNIIPIIFIKPLEDLLEENVSKIQNIEQLMEQYKKHLEQYLTSYITKIDEMKWQKDPLLSLFIDNCIEENKDISKGGAVYNHYGFTGVGLSNLVNSLININKFVFIDKKYTLEQINEIRKNNFKDNEKLLKELKLQKVKYGTDNEEVIKISNDIIRYATKVIEKIDNPLGGKHKFGLSAPTYIDAAVNFPASFDGRKNGEPFGVHISSDASNAYTELIQFASKLDYNENRFNGNVVDFIVSPNFIKNNFDKFVDFLMLSIEVGFFEMQMNVVNSKTLIEARKNPDKFPNLIVRVWGFSAYFNDLPDSYKDYIIERALNSESNS